MTHEWQIIFAAGFAVGAFLGVLAGTAFGYALARYRARPRIHVSWEQLKGRTRRAGQVAEDYAAGTNRNRG